MIHYKPFMVGPRARGPTPNDIQHPVTTQHTAPPLRSQANRVEPTRRKLHRPRDKLLAAVELFPCLGGGERDG